ncbi:MAG TPA: hypothetical protein VMQ76_01665 [Terracidiphilus sp.]|nr:hypothetical protein [Terracidiphilus sp.]
MGTARCDLFLAASMAAVLADKHGIMAWPMAWQGVGEMSDSTRKVRLFLYRETGRETYSTTNAKGCAAYDH